jgi:SAM-dependent methyltransferase
MLHDYLERAPVAVAIWRAAEAEALNQVALPRPLLDIGCGFGEFARVFFREAEAPEHGFDLDRGELLRAAADPVYAALAQGDARALPYGDAAFASVLSVSSLEHIPGVEPVFPEIARVLRPGGRLAFTVPIERLNVNLLGARVLQSVKLEGAARGYAAQVQRALTHVNVWPPERWLALTESSGLQIEHSRTITSPGATRLFELLLPAAFASRVYRKAFGRRPPHPGFFVRAVARGLSTTVTEPTERGSNLLVVARKAA